MGHARLSWHRKRFCVPHAASYRHNLRLLSAASNADAEITISLVPVHRYTRRLTHRCERVPRRCFLFEQSKFTYLSGIRRLRRFRVAKCSSKCPTKYRLLVNQGSGQRPMVNYRRAETKSTYIAPLSFVKNSYKLTTITAKLLLRQ